MKVFGCLGKKIGMTQICPNIKKGPIAVTAVWVGDNTVSQIKNKDKDGYDSFQIAFGFNSSKQNVNKPEEGHLKSKGIQPKIKLREIKQMNILETKIGSLLDPSFFTIGKRIKVTGTSKGKGFMGTIVRYGFSRGRMSHGASGPHRGQGSICSGRGDGTKVVKGKKMPGHMGNKKTTRMTIVAKVDNINNIVFLKGAVPGPKNGLVVLRQLIS